MEKINIPDGVTEIEECTFNECKSLKEVKIPDSAWNIEYRAFDECSSLEEIRIPDGVTEIRESAFARCDSLKEIRIPDSVTEIGRFAFEGCSSLKEINIPDSVTHMDGSEFCGCSSLKKINIDVEKIDLEKINLLNNSLSNIDHDSVFLNFKENEISLTEFKNYINKVLAAISEPAIEMNLIMNEIPARDCVEIKDGITHFKNDILPECVKELSIPSSMIEFGNQDITNLEKLSLPYNYLEGKNVDQFIDMVNTNPSLTISASPQDVLLLKGKVDATLESTISFLEYYKDPSVSIQENVSIDQQLGEYHIKQYDISNEGALFEVTKDDVTIRSENLYEAMKEVESILNEEELEADYEEELEEEPEESYEEDDYEYEDEEYVYEDDDYEW